jgi:2TM domain
MAATVLRRVGRVALSAVGRPTHYQGEAVALGIGREVSWMREITLEDYKRADRQLELKEARRGFTIHAIVYAVVMTSLIILNLTVAHEFLWFLFPLVGWGAGLTAHYLFRFRWLGAAITDRQARVQQRAATIRRAA